MEEDEEEEFESEWEESRDCKKADKAPKEEQLTLSYNNSLLSP